jgi:hypothetical protein
MQDQITKLCRKLMETERPDELQPVSAQLRRAIHERVDHVREGALEVALLDRIVSSHSGPPHRRREPKARRR